MRQQLTAAVPKFLLALDETFNSAKQFGGKTLTNVVQEDGDPVVSLLNSADMPTCIKGANAELIKVSKREGCCMRMFCTDNWKVGVEKLKLAADDALQLRLSLQPPRQLCPLQPPQPLRRLHVQQ
jgi:hypothetical protein